MRFSRRRVAAAACVVAAIVVALFAPIVGYEASVPVPFPPFLKPGSISCSSFSDNSTVVVTITQLNATQYEACLKNYRYGPINVTSRASLAYKYLGLGPPPFPASMIVTEGKLSALAYFSGDRVVAAQPLDSSNTLVNPPGIVIANKSVELTQLGYVNLTASFSNQSGQNVTDAYIWVSFPGSSGNLTGGGVTWAFFAGYSPLAFDHCQATVPAGATCTLTLKVLSGLLPGALVSCTLLVSGDLGGRPFVAKKWFEFHLPSSVVDKDWVSQFIGQVDSARNGSKLLESTSLDRFAALRFNASVSQPDVSDYGLFADTTSFFQGNSAAPSIIEVLLYPGSNFPFAYASYLQQYAPGHWSALTNTNYTRFGYYVGFGPYEIVNQPCPVTEIPRAGLNITQFFAQAGCSVSVQQATWLVIILAR